MSTLSHMKGRKARKPPLHAASLLRSLIPLTWKESSKSYHPLKTLRVPLRLLDCSLCINTWVVEGTQSSHGRPFTEWQMANNSDSSWICREPVCRLRLTIQTAEVAGMTTLMKQNKTLGCEWTQRDESHILFKARHRWPTIETSSDHPNHRIFRIS